jgi:hypothetical protein
MALAGSVSVHENTTGVRDWIKINYSQRIDPVEMNGQYRNGFGVEGPRERHTIREDI